MMSLVVNDESGSAGGHSVRIGDKIVCWKTGSLVDGDKKSRLEPLPLAFLRYLVLHSGQIIGREQLLAAVWENRHVSDDAIRRVVKKLREALGDDAKSPRYIKTVPLKGYMLIADISELAPAVAQLKTKRWQSALWLTGGCLLLILVAIILLYQQGLAKNNQPRVAIERLTHLSGSEINGDYSESLQTLIFTYRDNSNEPVSLYKKNLKTNEVARLNFDDASYYLVYFSPDSSQIVYLHESDAGTSNYLADFTADGLENTTQLTEFISELTVLSWSVDGKSLYFSGQPNLQPGPLQPDVTKIKNSAVIYRYRIADKHWQQITFPHLKGYGDYQTQESSDGRYLAVLRNTAERRYALIILDLVGKRIVSDRYLPFYASSLVWLKDQPMSLVMSSFKGDFYYYNAESDELVMQPGSKPGLNDVFYSCGQRCFYMRQHHMNYTDIKEIPNPFESQKNTMGIHFESDNAEFNAIYNALGDTIYFTSKDDISARLMRRVIGQTSETLFEFNPHHILTELAISPGEDFVSGKVEDRIFLFDLTSKELTFITSQGEQVSLPSWDRLGQAIYFSRAEQGQYVLLKYNVLSGETSLAEKDIRGRFEQADGRVFVIDTVGNLHQRTAGKVTKLITKLPLVMCNSWQVQGDYLYFTEHQGRDIYISRLKISNGESERKKLFENKWSVEFFLHPKGQKMLITDSILADSNLVKVQWP